MTSFYGGGAPSTSGGGSTPTKGALIFKGTLGISDDGATVLALPDAHEEGWTYLVVTAGTYAGQLCEEGDFVICVNSGEVASDLDWTVVQGNTFSTLPTPTALDEGKIISVGADGNYILTDNPAKDKLDKNNGTATGTTTFDKAQANSLELLVDGESIGGFRSIDSTPAVIEAGDKLSVGFVPLLLGEPTKDSHAATKKYVDGKVAQAAPVSMMPIPEVSGENLIQIKDSVEWPLQGLKVYGKSVQDGTPSPESPVPIVSAGASGSIETTITGKNLLTGRLYYGAYSSGIAYVKNENVVSLPYTPNYEVNGVCYTVSVKKGATYTFSVTNPNANASLFLSLYRTFENAFDYNNSIFKSQSVATASITASEDGVLVCLIAGTWTDGSTTIHECTESELLQLEIGSTATAYAAPHSQSIVAATPNGLPGIPVNSGGNYTDAEGQQSACDVKDYGTGKYTQMVGHIESYNGENITTPYMSTTGQLSTGAEVYYVLDEPVVTDISTEELAAYRTLHTYDGTTIISTNEDISGLKVKYIAKAIDYQQSINAAIQETNDKIDAVYNSLVKKAESVDEVNQLFKDWWNANWEEGSSTYNDMLERWFGKVLDDDKVYGVKLPLFETSTSPQGEYIEDSVGLTITNSTDEEVGQNDFAKTPQFWCVEVAAEKNADGSHTIYACEFIDDINVVRNGGPENGKHLVWVLQKNTYVHEYEESDYNYIKIQCHPADGFVQWPQGTDRTGHTYSYIANPKYAAGIDDEGNIGCRTGLKPTCYMSMNETIQAWRARGPQYSGSSACFYKWAYIMYALLTAKKGEDVGCNSYNLQYAAAVSESGVSRIILTADQANNLYAGSNVIIGNSEGNNDRGQAAMYSLVKLRKISSIEEVTIEEDASSYKAVYIDVPEGTTFNTTAGTTYISTMPYYSGWTDTVKGTIGTRYGTNLNKQPYLLQKVELMNGAYNYASDELDQWSQQDDTHYLYDFYLCEDQTKVSTNGTITDDYTKKENATLTIDTAVYTTNNSWYYIEDNLTDNNFKMLTPKKFSSSAGSGTGTRDAFFLSYAASEVRIPIVWASLWYGGFAGLSCRNSDGSPSWTNWPYAGGCPGLSG